MTKLFVNNLPDDASEERLKILFEQFGQVRAANIPQQANGKRAHYAFVEMPDSHQADVAVSRLNGYNFQGNPITVTPSI